MDIHGQFIFIYVFRSILMCIDLHTCTLTHICMSRTKMTKKLYSSWLPIQRPVLWFMEVLVGLVPVIVHCDLVLVTFVVFI